MTAALRELAWLEGPVDLARLGVFAVFVVLVAAAAWRPTPARGRAVVAYVLSVTCVVGLIQQESWPFAQWALVSHRRDPLVRSWELEATDASGRAWRVDPRVLQPLAPEEFGAWAMTHVPRLPLSGQQRVGAWLLDRAEDGRRRLLASGGGGVARNERWLGPLAAPYHFHEMRPWRSDDEVPVTPFVGVRLWELRWDIEARARGDRAAGGRRIVLAHDRS